MWCHKGTAQDNTRNSSTPEGSTGFEGESVEEPGLGATSSHGRSGWRRIAAPIALGVGLSAPHAACLLGLAGVSAAGFFGYSSYCGHSDPSSSHGVTLERLPKVPTDYEEFSSKASAQAAARLLDAQPRLRDVIAAKSEEANGALIQMVLVENNDDGCVVVGLCKEGMICPCTKPQFYNVGHVGDLETDEEFPGQHDVLRALYYPDGSRR